MQRSYFQEIYQAKWAAERYDWGLFSIEMLGAIGVLDDIPLLKRFARDRL